MISTRLATLHHTIHSMLIILMVIFGLIEPIWLCAYIVATLVLNILGVHQKRSIMDETQEQNKYNLLDSSLRDSK